MAHSRLKSIQISGYKSIGERTNISFGDITVFLGANGSGKSNLVSLFRMINYITSGGLQIFVGKQGGASSILYYGAKRTDHLSLSLVAETPEEGEMKTSTYEADLSYGASDRLFFASERILFQKSGFSVPQICLLDCGQESGLTLNTSMTARVMWSILSGIRTYQFHDTSDTAKMKSNGYINDNGYLRADAGNLAAFLFMLKNKPEYNQHYLRIERYITKVMPQFGKFLLEPSPENREYIRLQWIDRDGDSTFGAHQISDGSLRFMALSTLLLQPLELMPRVIVIDEPELGLHPSAIKALAALMRRASSKVQIVIATQSVNLVDEFTIEDVCIVERSVDSHSSRFQRLDENALRDWIQQYSLSELWEKNVLGGQP